MIGCTIPSRVRGRKPKPTNIRVLQGNPGRRPLPENEPQPPEGEIVPPSTLSPAALEYWKQHEPILLAMGVLTTADVAALAEMCEVEAEFWAARAVVHAEGMFMTFEGGRLIEHPAVKVASDAQKRLMRLQVEFGLTPSSRTRVKAQPKEAKKSALEELRESAS